MAGLKSLICAASLLLGTAYGVPMNGKLGQLEFGWLPDLLSSLADSPLTIAPAGKFSFKPSAGDTWNMQLNSLPTPSQARDQTYKIWDFDLMDAPRSLIKTFQDNGHPVICYFSAGSYEDWRDDAKDFPKAALGKPLDGWDGENWLDTRHPAVRAIMKKRIALAASKGCDGIDPDNMDGYSNDSGTNMQKADAVDYARFLAKTAHDAGMAYGLKNGGAFLDQVVDVAQFVVNEQCVQYNECHLYQPFIQQNKPVFHVEYTSKDSVPTDYMRRTCSHAGTNGFSTLVKKMSLNSWTSKCADY
ncbi:hypothetical protein LTR37_000257 [Vermiconidia calcicola]|uniref:Uncharacterized protein n=1 Tax=Vermiconidia calcicola TaxID=1690605 RepID=A0ACC3NZZ8_9PEZI|nr:hypothetical protein LTR37_000257 [Vermiconidia calcicola]